MKSRVQRFPTITQARTTRVCCQCCHHGMVEGHDPSIIYPVHISELAQTLACLDEHDCNDITVPCCNAYHHACMRQKAMTLASNSWQDCLPTHMELHIEYCLKCSAAHPPWLCYLGTACFFHACCSMQMSNLLELQIAINLHVSSLALLKHSSGGTDLQSTKKDVIFVCDALVRRSC